MEITELINKLKEALEIAETMQLNEMTAHRSYLPFPKFREEMLKDAKDRTYKSKVGENDEAYEVFQDVRIFGGCIRHVQEDHPDTTQETWDEFLNNFDPKSDEKFKAKVDGKSGKRYLYRFYVGSKCYAYIMDEYDRALPKLVSMWTDHPNTIQNWLNNEKVRGN